MTQEDVIGELRAYIARHYKTQELAAKHWGKSVYWVNMVLNGHRPPSDVMLKDVGIERVIPAPFYRKAKRGSQ